MSGHERAFAERFLTQSNTPLTDSSSSYAGPSGSRSFNGNPQTAMNQEHPAELTADALERLRIANDGSANPNSQAISSTRSAVRDGILRRQPSQTPSVTSVSTGPEDGESRERSRPSSRQTERYMKDQFGDKGNGKGKGKGREVGPSGTTISDLPGEVLISVRQRFPFQTVEVVLMSDFQSLDDRPGRVIVHKGLQAMVRHIVSYYMATTSHSQFSRIRQYRSSTLITESDTTICRCDQTDQSSQCGRRVRR